MWSENLIFVLILPLLWNKVFCAENEIDLSCRTAADCQGFEGGNITASCALGTCNCMGPRSTLVTCKPLQDLQKTNKIGGPCPCTIEHSTCDPLSKLCMCKMDYTSSIDSLKCIRSVVKLNGTCVDSSQCAKYDRNSECINHMCLCQPKNYTQVNNVCVKHLALTTSCTNDNECEGETKNSKCAIETRSCVCQDGYAANTLDTACLPAAEHNSSCTDINQCLLGVGVGSICDSGMCVCDAAHYKYIDEFSKKVLCMKTMRPGDTCEQHNECFNGTHGDIMECITGECHCRANYDRVNQYCYQINGAQSKNSITVFAILLIAGMLLKI